MDKLRALQYFATLVDTLSFSETASRFGVPTSSVSRRIRDLEEVLGVALFQRSTRSVQLTDLGRLYFNDITTALEAIETADELIGEQSRTPSGTLRITATPTYGELFVVPVLEQLRLQYPNIVVDLNLSDQVIDLSSHAIDIAIRTTNTLPDYVVARRLSEHRYVLAASPDYLHKNGTPRTVAELSNHPALVYRGPKGIMDWQAEIDGKWQSVEIMAKYVSNHGLSLVNAARRGEGITFLPRWGLVDDFANKQLTEIELPNTTMSIAGTTNAAVYLLYHPLKFRIQKIRVAIDYLLAALSNK